MRNSLESKVYSSARENAFAHRSFFDGFLARMAILLSINAVGNTLAESFGSLVPREAKTGHVPLANKIKVLITFNLRPVARSLYFSRKSFGP
jgi:hypothetical protein